MKRLPLAATIAALVCLTAAGAGAQDLEIAIPAGDVRAQLGGAGQTALLDQPACTAISLVANPATIAFGATGALAWTFEPQGCRRPAAYDNQLKFSSTAPGIAETPLVWSEHATKDASNSGSLWYNGRAPGDAIISAEFEGLTGSAAVKVLDRPVCTGLTIVTDRSAVPVGGMAKVLIPSMIGRVEASIATGRGDILLSPPGCAMPADSRTEIVVSPREVASLDSGRTNYLHDFTGRTRGVATITAKIGTLTASTAIEVTPPPACDELTAYFPGPIAIGEVTGVAYRGGVGLFYKRRGAALDLAENCAKPAGMPRYESVTAAASVDPFTGAVTGLQAGMARIGVVHGDLVTVAPIEVLEAAAKPCTALTAPFDIRLRVGEHADFDARYEPFDCNAPLGAPSFVVTPDQPVIVSADGVVFARAPGTASVTMNHAGLSLSRSIVVTALRPCTAIGGSFNPPEISPWRHTVLTLDYGPLPCAPPVGEPRFFHDLKLGLVGTSGQTAEFKPQFGGSEGWAEWIDLVIDVEVRHGNLRKILHLPSEDESSCRFGNVSVSKTALKPGDRAILTLEANRRDCEATSDLIRVSTAGVVFITAIGDGRFYVAANRGGSTEISGPAGTPVTMTVAARDCEEVQLSYGAVPLKKGDIRYPDIGYKPEGCTRPGASPEFTSDAPQMVFVDPRYQRFGVGAVRARGLGLSGWGDTTITMRHGPLTASASVTVDGG